MDIEHYRDLALQKQKIHRQFLTSLKKKPPKNLDKLTKELHDEVFTEIDCTQCANCCKSLGPLFTESDIERVAKRLRMKLANFESEYLQVDEDGDKIFHSAIKNALIGLLVITLSYTIIKLLQMAFLS